MWPAFPSTRPTPSPSPVNGNGTDKGFEFAWDQDLWYGFGIQTNATISDGEQGASTGGGSLIGDSKYVFNVVPYYEDHGFSLRLAYTWRTKVLVGLDRSTAENEAAMGTLALSASYDINDNVSLTFDALNLNDPILKYYANDPDQPRAFYDNGRQFYFGVKVNTEYLVRSLGRQARGSDFLVQSPVCKTTTRGGVAKTHSAPSFCRAFRTGPARAISGMRSEIYRGFRNGFAGIAAAAWLLAACSPELPAPPLAEKSVACCGSSAAAIDHSLACACHAGVRRACAPGRHADRLRRLGSRDAAHCALLGGSRAARAGAAARPASGQRCFTAPACDRAQTSGGRERYGCGRLQARRDARRRCYCRRTGRGSFLWCSDRLAACDGNAVA